MRIDKVKTPNLFERAKEEIEAHSHHHKETHGMRSDIDEKTPLDDVRAPNVFERVKEEVEALIQTIHPHKDSSSSTHGTRFYFFIYFLMHFAIVKDPNLLEV